MSLSLRTRLGLCYGGLTGFVVLLVAGGLYAVHARAQYDAVDQTVSDTAVHAAAEYLSASPSERAEVISVPVGLGVGVRVYSESGGLVAQSPSATLAPPFEVAPPPVRSEHSPLDLLAKVAPGPDRGASSGTYRMVVDADGNRWRAFTLPLDGTGEMLVTVAPLAQIDVSVTSYRRLVPIFALTGALVTLTAGWLLAAQALRPVASLTATASEIARSRALDRRVPSSAHRDELGQLAATFNDMLDSLEEGYRSQQRFIADASHELRAPLTAIQANLELLERHPDMTLEDRRVATCEASREARRLAALVVDLLALARADAGIPMKRTRLDLSPVVLDAVSEARHLGRQRLEIEHLDPATVEGDPDKIRQLLIILLDNAAKYTPSGGQITVGLRRIRDDVELSVRDTGAGIEAKDLRHVFERFYRADPARGRDPGGTGLGLPIAEWITKQHGGRIWLESTPGQGTTARVRLPLHAAGQAPRRLPHARMSAA